MIKASAVYRLRRRVLGPTRYVVSDRLHQERQACVTEDQLTATVSAWLGELGVQSALPLEFTHAVCTGDWPSVYAIADTLAIDVIVAT